MNYLIVVLATTVATFLLHPSSLFVLAALLGAWVYLLLIRKEPVVIGGRQLRWERMGVVLRSAQAAAQAAGSAARVTLCSTQRGSSVVVACGRRTSAQRPRCLLSFLLQ